jgi:hypothetical protein
MYEWYTKELNKSKRSNWSLTSETTPSRSNSIRKLSRPCWAKNIMLHCSYKSFGSQPIYFKVRRQLFFKTYKRPFSDFASLPLPFLFYIYTPWSLLFLKGPPISKNAHITLQCQDAMYIPLLPSQILPPSKDQYQGWDSFANILFYSFIKEIVENNSYSQMTIPTTML